MDFIVGLFLSWWYIVALVIYTIMNIVRSFKIVNESELDRNYVAANPDKYPNGYPMGMYGKTRLQFYGYGLREVFFDTKEEYFRLWDIVVFVFYVPAIIMSFVYLLMKAGALEFMPFLRRVFGFKLFRIRKPEVKKNEQVSGSNG